MLRRRRLLVKTQGLKMITSLNQLNIYNFKNIYAYIFFLIVVVLCPASLVWAQKLPENNSCINCHSEMVDDLKDSVHFQHGIYCNNCHGGDAAQKEKNLAKAPSAGYVGVPDKKQIAQICGNCHADVETMNFYGIRTDQLARYKTSRHGKKLLLDGDTKVAVCSDCHGYHDVLPVSDPNSPAYPANVPKTCNRCHGNEKIMAPYKKPTDIFEKYKNSVHGKALFEKKDMGVATCISCHGNHGAVPPGVKDIGEACGKCHINERTNFLESVHAKITGSNFSQCVACHSNHDIQPVSLDLYTKACGKCHEPKSKAFAYGQKMWRNLYAAQEDLKEARGIVKQAGIEGIFVEAETALLEDAKTKVFEMGPAQHTLSSGKVEAIYKQVQEKTREIKADIHKKRESLKLRKLALGPLWIFIVIMSIAFYRKYEQLKSADKKKKEE